jgi:hypothetical protein
MVIALDSKLEAAVSEQARRQGVAAEALALEALRDRFLAPTQPDASPDEWVRRLRQVATDCGVSLPDAAVSREGIYE